MSSMSGHVRSAIAMSTLPPIADMCSGAEQSIRKRACDKPSVGNCGRLRYSGNRWLSLSRQQNAISVLAIRTITLSWTAVASSDALRFTCERQRGIRGSGLLRHGSFCRRFTTKGIASHAKRRSQNSGSTGPTRSRCLLRRQSALMSALGQKQTCVLHQPMSALPPKADICGALTHVRFVPIADNVR